MKAIPKKYARAGSDSPEVRLNHLDFGKVTPVSARGFGVLQNSYCGGRVGAMVNHFGGFNVIEYWGVSPMHFSKIYFKGDPATAYARCFRAEIVIDGNAYILEFNQTHHFAFGYRSDFAVPELGVALRHRLTLINDALIFSIEVLRNKRNLPIRQRIEHHNFTFNEFPGRTRTEWERGLIPTGWVMTATDTISDARWKELRAEMKKADDPRFPPPLAQGPRKGTAWIAVTGEGAFTKRRSMHGKDVFVGPEFRRGTHACSLLFASSRADLVRRAREMKKTAVARVKERERENERRLAVAPQFHSGDPVLDSMAANVPPVYDSFTIEDLPGAARGASLDYYVWGWDTLNCADVPLLSGQADFAREVIRFYRDTADPKFGVGHQYTTDHPPKVRVTMAPSAQMVYVIFLHQYGAYTGDRAMWREFFPFVRKIFTRCLAAIDKRGLGEGAALWPDYPTHCGHTGRDITVFNNSIQYQGLRCVERMAVEAGDAKTAAKAGEICRRMEKNFVPTFWDKKRGYFADSVDAKTGRQRPSYPAHALLWLTPFLHDLVGRETLKACAGFAAKNLAAQRGFLSYPRWDKAFDADGNQLGMIWPTHDMFTMRCQAIAGRDDMLEGWIASSDWFWKQLTYIEGYVATTLNDSGTPDRIGAKMNFFGTKTTYMTFFTGLAGVHFDVGGLTLGEGIARPMRVTQVPFRGAKITLSTRGKGRFARKLTVNGHPVAGSLKIPLTRLKGRVTIDFERTDKAPAHPVIRSLYGAEVRDVAVERATLSATIAGAVPAWLHYYAPRSGTVRFNGRELTPTFSARTGEGRVLLPLAGRTAKLEIAAS